MVSPMSNSTSPVQVIDVNDMIIEALISDSFTHILTSSLQYFFRLYHAISPPNVKTSQITNAKPDQNLASNGARY